MRLANAEGHLASREFKKARLAAWEAGSRAMDAYGAFRGIAAGVALAEKAKALGLPFEVFAVCDKLDQEDPNLPKRMLPLRPEGEEAADRVHQARSLLRFLKWAAEEPPKAEP